MSNYSEIEKKPIYKKWWFWVLIVLIIVIIGTAIGGNQSDSENVQTSKQKNDNKIKITVIDFSAMEKKDIQDWCNTNRINYAITEEYSDTVTKGSFVSQSINTGTIINQGDKINVIYSLGKEPTTEQKNALKQAESYSKNMHMSKKGIYNQLTSEYGGKFPADAAQYAIDNIQANWNENALVQAKSYQNNMSMSKSRIYDQLISEYGGKFTKEEAQYAIDHLED